MLLRKVSKFNSTFKIMHVYFSCIFNIKKEHSMRNKLQRSLPSVFQPLSLIKHHIKRKYFPLEFLTFVRRKFIRK